MMDDEPLYTMEQAAKRKGVSYHTVSRAVRSGRLPMQRLGRMALIGATALDAWQPMVQRAPKRYRRRAPDLTIASTSVRTADLTRAALEREVLLLAQALRQRITTLENEHLMQLHGLLSASLTNDDAPRE